MTYAAFDAAMMWVWVAFFVALVGFGVWAAWALLIDEPRKRKRIEARLAQVVPAKRPQ